MTMLKTKRHRAKLIAAAVVHAEWRKDAAYRAAYDALEDEFAILTELIDARAKASLSQSDVAARMKTTQPAIARLEGGAHRASLKTLRSYAEATGHRLRIVLEPLQDKARSAGRKD